MLASLIMTFVVAVFILESELKNHLKRISNVAHWDQDEQIKALYQINQAPWLERFSYFQTNKFIKIQSAPILKFCHTHKWLQRYALLTYFTLLSFGARLV